MRPVWLALAALSLVGGALCAGGFAWGLVRDSGVGDGELVLPLAAAGPWSERPFRPWLAGEYAVALQSVNHAPPFGARFRGELEVRVRRPDGSTALAGRYRPDDHERPENTSFSALAPLRVDRSGPWRWTLAARVLRGDPAFAGVHSTVRAMRSGRDVGMGGLIHYALIVPAFVLLSLAAAFGILARGRRPGRIRSGRE